MSPDLASEQHFTVEEVCDMWAISRQTVYRLFQDEPGVLRISPRGKRALLRIPESVLARLHEERSRGFRLKQRSAR